MSRLSLQAESASARNKLISGRGRSRLQGVIPVNDCLREKLRALPSGPGCYLYRDRNGTIIYVGKAVNLRRRVTSYFRESSLQRGSPKLRGLVNSIADLEWIDVRNEAEALLTEGRLIKDYRPHFNVSLRDDKRYLVLRAETHLGCPRFAECRIVKDDGDEYFGPFPSSSVVRLARDFVERRWGLRKCDAAEPDGETHRHCHNDRIACCSAPCVGGISPEAYRARFEEACAFLRHGDPEVFAALEREMAEASAAEEFEKAADLRDTAAALRELVRLRAKARPAAAVERSRALAGMEELGRLLRLPGPPHVVEGFDISHIGGEQTVASMVAGVDGVTTPNRYRRFRIRTVAGIDDPASIAEVVGRRYARLRDEGRPMPDLVLVDGGVTQVRAARAALAALGLDGPPVVGLAERREILVVDWEDGTREIELPRESEALRALMRLRDEAHRFAITYNKRLRLQRIRESALDEVPGVGASRKRALLRAFGSVRRIADADVGRIAAVDGIGPKLAEEILRTARRNVGNLPPDNRV